jgi:hypothetical protein
MVSQPHGGAVSLAWIRGGRVRLVGNEGSQLAPSGLHRPVEVVLRLRAIPQGRFRDVRIHSAGAQLFP